MSVVKGFVPTPATTVDLMVAKLFGDTPPDPSSTLLDPGCGEGVFIEGVVRYCRERAWRPPRIVGIELDPVRAAASANKFAELDFVQIRHDDFLRSIDDEYDYIVGNPPYVSIGRLSLEEREEYRASFATARGRFDLYLLFFEQALRTLRPRGRLVFITPEKFLYVETARPLRNLLNRYAVEELHFLDEATFGELVTYPLVTTVHAGASLGRTRIHDRDGSVRSALLRTGDSWLPRLVDDDGGHEGVRLADICRRISCGVATGADSIFVVRAEDMPDDIAEFAHPTISGRQLTESPLQSTRSRMLIPYDETGRLLPEDALGALGSYLGTPHRRSRLEARTCNARKPWYAFHDACVLPDILRPKLLCKDITASPSFVIDWSGEIVPRHSVYYIVPKNPENLVPLASYLNSREARAWMTRNCQRAAGGFLRLQSQVLKQLPIPQEVVSSPTVDHSRLTRTAVSCA